MPDLLDDLENERSGRREGMQESFKSTHEEGNLWEKLDSCIIWNRTVSSIYFVTNWSYVGRAPPGKERLENGMFQELLMVT